MLLSHILTNQIAEKPVCTSCHTLMCWYELTVQFCESSTCMYVCMYHFISTSRVKITKYMYENHVKIPQYKSV